MMALRSIFFISAFFLALIAALPAMAQTSIIGATSPLLIEFTPANPEPGERIDVTVASLTLDLSEKLILWYVDNEIVESGVGATRASVQVSASGEATRIEVVVAEGQQAIARAGAYIRPGTVDLLWESDSLAPPLYKGRRLASPSSLITVEARAALTDTEGAAIPPTSITYTWYRNGALLKDASGRGKSSMAFGAPALFGGDTIRVVASAGDRGNQAEKSVVIPAVDPGVILYKDDPLFGTMYHTAIGNSATFAEGEVAVIAFPLFAPLASSPRDDMLEYSWRVNGRKISPDTENPHRLTINAENSSGIARLALSVTHLIDITMQAAGEWNLLLNAGLGGSGGENNLFAPDTSI